MPRKPSARLTALEDEWRRRFGEPPAITANAQLLAKILRQTEAKEKRA
jgi:hypothetical protein